MPNTKKQIKKVTKTHSPSYIYIDPNPGWVVHI